MAISFISTDLTKLMNHKKTANFIFFIAVFARLLYLYFFPLQETDYQMLYTAADNFLNGKGLGFTRSLPNDLSAFYFEGLRLWPPLTPVVLALTKSIVKTIFLTDLITISLSIFFIMLLSKKIMDLLEIKNSYQSLLWLFAATNPDWIKTPGLSDLIGGLFLLLAFYRCLCCINNRYTGSFALITSSFVYFLPAAVRYQYYPVVFLFPCCLILSGWLIRDKKIITNAVISLFLVALFLSLQEICLHLYTHDSLNSPLVQDRLGFYPSNLLMTYPLLLKVIINSGYLENRFLANHEQLKIVYSLLSLLSILLLTTFLLSLFYKRVRHTHKNKLLDLLPSIFALVISSGVVYTLFFLSLSHNSRTGLPGGWTYVADGRYYIGPSVLILVFFFKGLQCSSFLQKKPLKSMLKYSMLFLLIYNTTLSGKFLYNISTHNIPDKEIGNREDRVAIEKIIRHLAKDTLPVVATYSSNYFAFYPVQENYAVTNKISVLADSGYRTSRQIQLLFIVSGKQNEKQNNFLQRNRTTELYKGKESVVYYLKLPAFSKSN